MTTTNNYNYELICAGFAAAILCFPIIFSLPIIEISYGFYYKDAITCNSFLSISDWLRIKGFIFICYVIALLSSFAISNKNVVTCLCFPVITIFNIFILTWSVIGSVIFYRDCYNVKPESINVLMWISLIAGYFSILQIFISNKNNQNPLLG